MLEERMIYSIKELTNYIKTLIEKDPLLSEIWLRGEISNFTHHSSGHMYFTLKDEASKVRSIMFLGNNRFLRFIPKNGMKIIVKGYVSLYERDGQYQFYVQEMQPDGLGQLYIAYEQLKEKLEKEGLFDPRIKQKLPAYPETLGIITSATGAAIRDMVITIKRRYPIVQILIYPVAVQGENAPQAIANAITQMNIYGGVDLLIVGRGGGSIEELWAFNEEVVARSIFASRIPIISAVGHETDFTIADFVADIRAATPTAAAELAVPNIEELKTNIVFYTTTIFKQLERRLDQSKRALNQALKSTVFKRPKQRLLENYQRVDSLAANLRYALNRQALLHKDKLSILQQRFYQENPAIKIKNQRNNLQQLKRQLVREITLIKKSNEQRLDVRIAKLDALNPLKIMRRGYAIPYSNKKMLVKSINDVQLGDILKLQLADGKLDCQVWSMEEDNDPRKKITDR